MPDPGAPPPPSSHAALAARRPSVLRQRLLAGLALLVLGSVVGLGVAHWRAAEPPPGPALGTAAVDARPAAPAPAQPPLRPVSTSASEVRRGVEQLDARALLRAGVPATDWRLARLQGNPQVLVLEFPGLTDQGAAMNRAAAFVEKDGAPRDRVLDDHELEQLIRRQGDNAQTFFQGHDYAADDLARFFTAARRQALTLNAQERRLLGLLIDQRVIAAQGKRYEALGLQAIVTFTGTQADDPRTAQDEAVDERRRESVLLHELSHGLYFTSTAYREHCRRFWRERMSADERAAFTDLLKRLNYDPRNEDLLINEMQALLMHTPDTRAFSGESLGLSEERLARLRTRFAEGLPLR